MKRANERVLLLCFNVYFVWKISQGLVDLIYHLFSFLNLLKFMHKYKLSTKVSIYVQDSIQIIRPRWKNLCTVLQSS